MTPEPKRLPELFRLARSSAEDVVLEGFHPLKHALRFGASVSVVACVERARLDALLDDHAPELAAVVAQLVVEVPRQAFKRLGPYEPHTGVVSIAQRPSSDPAALLMSRDGAPLVLLEDPRHRGNLGAVVRVAVAAGAAGVLSTGAQDPWHPVAVRGSAGLHFALPVARLEGLPRRGASLAGAAATHGDPGEPLTDRPLVALDPGGESLAATVLPPRAILAFGSERRGVSDGLRERADRVLGLPMREGVSSLNLATSVAAVLYSAWLLAPPAVGGRGGRALRPGTDQPR
ncbi:MAG: rRNA methyltransferase [Acidobacteriota bacterium]|nr:rRNA methyltransferase [Acidobacteriota bacterium]